MKTTVLEVGSPKSRLSYATQAKTHFMLST